MRRFDSDESSAADTTGPETCVHADVASKLHMVAGDTGKQRGREEEA